MYVCSVARIYQGTPAGIIHFVRRIWYAFRRGFTGLVWKFINYVALLKKKYYLNFKTN